MISFIRKHPLGVGSAVVAGIAALAWLAFGFFGVHTLFIDDVVDEAGPVFDAAPVTAVSTPGAEAIPTPDASTPGAAAATADDTTASATTSVTTATTDGTAAEPDTAPGAPTSAPAATPASPAATEVTAEAVGTFVDQAHPTDGTATVLGNGTGQRFLRFEDFATDNGPDLNVYLVNSSTGDVSDYVDLGDLTGNIGDQNYEVPEGVDLDTYDTVVIWCVRFAVSFGEATLSVT